MDTNGNEDGSLEIPSLPSPARSRVRSVIICWIFCPSAPQRPDLLTAKTEEDLSATSATSPLRHGGKSLGDDRS